MKTFLQKIEEDTKTHNPEGGHEEPTKLANRAEFAKQNLLKERK